MIVKPYSPDEKIRWLQYVVYGSVILYFGKDIFIPLSFAALISFISYPVCVWFEKKGLGRMTAIVITISILMIFLLAAMVLLVTQFIDFLREWPSLQQKLSNTFQGVRTLLIDSYGISPDQQDRWLNQLLNQSGSGVFTILHRTISASAFSGVLMVLIPVYAVLILYYRHLWVQILYRIFPHEHAATINEILTLTIKAYYNFIKGMAVVYLIVGGLNSIGLLLLGIPHAILFGFIASILTFIPYVGIIAGSLLPIAVAWITYDSVWYPVGVVGIFAFVQYLEGNVIFPIAVSNRLQVNTLVMLIAIFLGGILWGVAGMILFVPFVGIAKLIADHNPKLKTLSMILGTPRD